MPRLRYWPLRSVLLGSIICLLHPSASAAAIPKQTRAEETTRGFYLQNSWVPLAVPDAHAGPGSMFSLSEDGALTYVYSLSDCKVPIATIADSAAHLDFKESISYAPGAVLGLSGVSPGPGFGNVTSVTVEQWSHGPVALDSVALHLWLADPNNAGHISAYCKRILNKSNVYIAEESYVVTKGRYVLKDHNGAVIDLRTASPAPLKIAVRPDLRITSDGGLEFEQQLYTAARRLSPANRSPNTLGQSHDVPKDADDQVRQAMIASAKLLVEPPVVYNALFAPTLPNRKAEIVDGTPSTVSFFIGPPNSQNAIDDKNWTVAPKLLDDKSTVPLIVRMTCTFCKDEMVQKQPITYFGSKRSSTAAIFKFIPQKAKVKDVTGVGQVDFQITQNNIELDYIVVKVKVSQAATAFLAQQDSETPPAQAVSLRKPAWARDIDLTLSIRSGVGGRLEVSFASGTPEVSALLGGKQNLADGTIRWYRTGLNANQIATLEGNLYLQLSAAINNDLNLKSILSGSASAASEGVSAELLSDADQKRLVQLLASNGGTWYKKLFVAGAEADLTALMTGLRSYSRADRPVRMRIESQGIYLPWQMVIPPSDSVPKAEEFWGFRYELSVDPTGIDLPGGYLGPLQYGGGPLVFGQYRGAAPDDVVGRLAAEELKYLQNTFGVAGIISANSRDAFKSDLVDHRGDVRLVLTFTHGANGTIIDSGGQLTQDAAGPKLIFAPNEYLPVSVIGDLIAMTPADEISYFPGGPIVFLNGCETGTDGFYTTTNEDFPGTFLTMGSRGVIVTEAPIWTYFGYNFGRSLLQELKNGEPVTSAILKTRTLYLQTAHNPLGLLYSYYGGADVAVTF